VAQDRNESTVAEEEVDPQVTNAIGYTITRAGVTPLAAAEAPTCR
jgi:hypothetical protein